MLRIVTGGGGTLSSTPVSNQKRVGQELYPRPFVGEGVRRTGEGSHSDKIAQQVRNDSICSLAPRRESGFAYGRSEASPDSEQIEHVIAEQFMRNSVSVEQIQDGLGRGGRDERCRLTRGADKPSRGTSEARGEQESAETLSFRCDCERCRLMRGAKEPSETSCHRALVARPISQTCIEKTKSLSKRGGKTSNRQAAFTLAEVLITLGIIGVVAALTMPALITNIQDRIQQKRIENINQKLSKVTDKMAVQSGLTGYGTTMAFVQEMSKHMKIAKICDNEHLAECWPTQEVTLNDEGKTWEIAKTKNAKTLKISNNAEDWADTVGIVTGDGTGMILSYNKKCEFSVDDKGFSYSDSKSNSLSCLAGAFDWNGSSKPNKLGKDVTMLAPASGLGTNCAIEAGGKCFTAAFKPTPLTKAQCEAEKDELGIKGCGYASEYWAGAVKQCGGVSKMPTLEDLGKLATELYKEHPSVGAKEYIDSVTLDTSKAASMGFTGASFQVWSGEEENSYYASTRPFHSSDTGLGSAFRRYSGSQAVCLGD